MLSISELGPYHRVLLPSSLNHATQMVQVCGASFEKHRQVVIDRAVGGGIVCSLDEHALRTFLADTSISLKPQQDVIVEALGELRRNTEAAVAALEVSGSPYTLMVVRALKTHNVAYVTFTKVRVQLSVQEMFFVQKPCHLWGRP